MAKARDYGAHLDEVLKDDAEAVAYPNAALAEDPEVFLLALRDVARTREGGLKRAGIPSSEAWRPCSTPSGSASASS